MTNSEGYYASAPLGVGTYRVEAKMSGFRRAFRGGIVLQIQQTAVIDFTLELGAVSEEVEVKAEAPVLESTTTTLGKVVDNRRIGDLPLNTRNVYSLIFLTPGVIGQHRQQLQQLELFGERRAPDDDGHRDRRRDGVIPDGQWLYRHLDLPVG